MFDKLICAISIICLDVVLVLVLLLKDSLRTYFKSLSLSWSLEVRSSSLSWSLGVRSFLTSLINIRIVFGNREICSSLFGTRLFGNWQFGILNFALAMSWIDEKNTI